MKNNDAIISSQVKSSYIYDFLITGANFGNKGAESMLYVTVDELTKRFPSCNIYFATTENYPEKNYTFRKVFFSNRTSRIAMGGPNALKALPEEILRDVVKFVIGRRITGFRNYFALSKCITDIDAVIDISGYSLSSKWGNRIPHRYINKILLAKRFNIPMYLMPQSFGPFEYTPDVMQKAKPILKKVLDYPRIIFAREQEGFDSLNELRDSQNQNMRTSADLVLQNTGIDMRNIFKNPPALSIPKIESEKELVAIIPNMRCFDHGDKNEILEAYKEIISCILSQGYKAVLFRHSREDIKACHEIKEIFSEDENVIVVENEFSCLEYNEFVKQFKFLVCSRYHGIVHAYKNIIPCIALGWAVKYKSLAERLGQDRYVFDITGRINIREIVDALRELMKNYDSEKGKIQHNLTLIQKNNCFDAVEEDIRMLRNKK